MQNDGQRADVRKLDELQEQTFAFACRIVKLCDMLGQGVGSCRALSSELLRSGTSVGATVAQTQSADSEAEVRQILESACKGVRETHYWLRLIIASDFVAESSVTTLLDEANRLVDSLTS